jgi:hypothetical protein
MTFTPFTLHLPAFRPGGSRAGTLAQARFPGLSVFMSGELMVLGPDDEVAAGIRMWVEENWP